MRLPIENAPPLVLRTIASVAVMLAVAIALVPIDGRAQAAKKKTAAAKKEAKMAAAPTTGPAITRVEPRGMQRGVEARIRLTGIRLDGLTNVTFSNPRIVAELVPGAATNEAVLNVKIAGDVPRGPYEFSVKGAQGESPKVKFHVDDFPQVYEVMGTPPAQRRVENLPVSFWGTIDKPGRSDHFAFHAVTGQTVVFELAAESLGSKATEATMTLTDATGAVLASNNGFDGGSDALIAYKFTATGDYSIRVNDLALGGGPDNFFRLSVGAVPYVTGIFPLSVRANSEAEVELVGYNLPRDTKVKVKAGAVDEAEVPIDLNRFHARKAFKVMVANDGELVEKEPNDTPQQAMPIAVPTSINGRIWASTAGQVDEDLYRFEAKAGQPLVIETLAARRGSPVDTKIEILHADGRPVERVLLQATRDSYITFRSVDSVSPDVRVKNWEEMELNEYMYMQGEVCRIFRMPQGPDSGFRYFADGAKRRNYFDTSGTAHALDEPCYIVQAHPPGTKLVANGLPVFPLNYVNDDDAERKLGTDSRLHFTAPADGAYLVRVTDNRGFGGDRFSYRLTVREARPDFKVTLIGANPTVDAGAGIGFSVKANRLDGFDESIKVEITGLPKGYFATTPVVIESGLLEAGGTLFADADAPKLMAEDWAKVKVTATANLAGKPVSQAVNNFGTVKLLDRPKMFLSLQPNDVTLPAEAFQKYPEKPLEIVIAPGTRVPAWLRIVRNGDTNLVNMDVDNLPHGVIVANIGLNGVQVRAGETERQIFLEAARWVPEMERLCHAVSQSARAGGAGAGKQTSFPVLIKVRKPATTASLSP